MTTQSPLGSGSERTRWAALGALACALFVQGCDSEGENDGPNSGTSGTAGTSGASGTSGTSGAGASGATGGVGGDAGEGGRGDGGGGNDGGTAGDAGTAGSGGDPGDEGHCGDGSLDVGEDCDDGNLAAGDGCFECAIESGYRCNVTQSPSSCADIDECLEGANDCSLMATCRNTLGSFVCVCNAGLVGTDPACTPPSCDDVDKNCGPRGDESCCESLLVEGGAYYRFFDGVSADYSSRIFPGQVSDFRLDRFEVTVSRFRKFLSAWDGGWRPTQGAGKHVHLNGGEGLRFQDDTAYESGWEEAMFGREVALTISNLTCPNSQLSHPTFTTTGRNNENRPMVCANWYEAYAFCIWDGGFLPTETEWNYAASGGAEQRVFPWSNPPSSTDIDCSLANYPGCSRTEMTLVGSFSPEGDGKYGQADLAGNAWEFTLDPWVRTQVEARCDDCILVSDGWGGYQLRGGGLRGGFTGALPLTSVRWRFVGGRADPMGFRCARVPVADPPCGDGNLDDDEACDDGNTFPNDGCFVCKIESGFVCDNAQTPSRCMDVNECANGTAGCSADATCTNTGGSFSCACNEGYAGTGFGCGAVDESLLVSGGEFFRSYDGVENVDMSYPATVSDFRLDRFEATVGRFREFMAAWNQGWRPAAGAGKHTHLSGGNGLVDSSATGAYEPGWDQSWNAYVDLTPESLVYGTISAGNEYLPITYINWYEAYGFCIWDGGFLPTETEWNYAASGGAEQRVFPWSNPPESTMFDCTYVSCMPVLPAVATAGRFLPKGDGRYGQADLSYNAQEWVLDTWSDYVTPCVDCAYLSWDEWSGRTARGGNFWAETNPHAASRTYVDPRYRGSEMGVRCARAP